jgi:hypothetical protein
MLRLLPREAQPVFYLCKDKDALDQMLAVRSDIEVHMLTVQDLIEALIEQDATLPLAIRIPSYNAVVQEIAADRGESSGHGAYWLGEDYSNLKNKTAFAESLAPMSKGRVRNRAPSRADKFNQKYGLIILGNKLLSPSNI